MNSSSPRTRTAARALGRVATVAVVALFTAACVDPVTEPGALDAVAGDQATGQDEGAGAEQRPERTDPQDPQGPQAGDRDASAPDTGDPDTSAPDTGHPDTGDPDAGDPDAGDPDTGDPEGDAEGGDGSQPGAGPQNRLPDELLGLPDDCGPEVVAAAVDTIAAQLEDFARGDFSAALDHATSAFQSGIDADAFQALIEVGYPLLLQDATAELARCTRRGPDTVEVGVEVTTADRVSAPFAYRLRLDGGRWAIDGAVRLTPPPATT